MAMLSADAECFIEWFQRVEHGIEGPNDTNGFGSSVFANPQIWGDNKR